MNRRARNTLVYGDRYEGYPLMADKGPFIRGYLDKIIDVMDASLEEHPRTFAVRLDLRLPSSLEVFSESRLIDRFISSLKSKVQHARARASRHSDRTHTTSLRYVWAREIGNRGRPHYHFVIFLNRDAFNSLGKFRLGTIKRGTDNLYSRIVEAWASALGIENEDAIGLPHFPRNAIFAIKAGSLGSQDALFERASYLAKDATKVRGGRHCFGGSRR